MSSNLPPGVSSPDGGIDHDWETACENLLDCFDYPKQVNDFAALAPVFLEVQQRVWKEGYRAGYDERAEEARREKQAAAEWN